MKICQELSLPSLQHANIKVTIISTLLDVYPLSIIPSEKLYSQAYDPRKFVKDY